jgi:hypothetical protein
MSRTSPEASLPQGNKKMLSRQTRRVRTSKRYLKAQVEGKKKIALNVMMKI